MQMEEENPILELSDDLNNLQNRIPSYKKNRPVGIQSLIPFSGFMCEICHRSFSNEETAQVRKESSVLIPIFFLLCVLGSFKN